MLIMFITYKNRAVYILNKRFFLLKEQLISVDNNDGYKQQRSGGGVTDKKQHLLA